MKEQYDGISARILFLKLLAMYSLCSNYYFISFYFILSPNNAMVAPCNWSGMVWKYSNLIALCLVWLGGLGSKGQRPLSKTGDEGPLPNNVNNVNVRCHGGKYFTFSTTRAYGSSGQMSTRTTVHPNIQPQTNIAILNFYLTQNVFFKVNLSDIIIFFKVDEASDQTLTKQIYGFVSICSG